MTQFSVYKLHFTAPLHIGNCRNDYDISQQTISSDTMYAAVISCLAKLGMDIPDNGDLGCVISSLFPFYQKDKDGETTYFLPKPIGTVYPDNPNEAKKIKKINWLDIPNFQKLISGELDVSKIEIEQIKSREFLTSDEISEDFISSQVDIHVSVPRDPEEDAKPYYMDRIHFKDSSGLYFIIHGDSSLFEKGLFLLQQEGVGTDRNVGNGTFEFEKIEQAFELVIPKNTCKAISLSMYIPESEEQLQEMLGEDCSYDIARRGGWITTFPYNTYRKNTIYALNPGSVLNMESDELNVKGKIVDLSSNAVKVGHSIWRDGKSLFIPAKI